MNLFSYYFKDHFFLCFYLMKLLLMINPDLSNVKLKKQKIHGKGKHIIRRIRKKRREEENARAKTLCLWLPRKRQFYSSFATNSV